MKDDGRPPPFALEFHREADKRCRHVATFPDSEIRVPMSAEEVLKQGRFRHALLRYCLENAVSCPEGLAGEYVGTKQWRRWIAASNSRRQAE